eukprot:Seg1983.6 transcript_id=Seg1983.6/GoldUCD/mRNA.D3Y31 product="hypothetical protein" protein_id=Seg1983.6/GoldUCD/D3Y31
MLLQELWRRKLGWDDDIDEDLKTSWRKWLDALDSIGNFMIPRRYVNEEVVEYQLHLFADASEPAFGAVAYLLFIHSSGRKSCSFVMSKTRLAPLKTLTIVRLELQAAVLAVRLHSAIQGEFDLETSSTHFWTDSMITLQYIRNENRRLKTFVANRVAEIRENTKPSQWHHIDGKENPADDCSRGLHVSKITPESRWLNGPAFRCHDGIIWPEEQDQCSLAEEDPEVKKERILATKTAVLHQSPIEIGDFSTWKRLTRIMSWVLRACKMFKKQISSKPKMTFTSLDPTESDAAIKLLVRHVQQAAFSEEFQALQDETRKLKGRLKALNPFIDKEGLLRVGGRLKHAPIDYSARHELILPARHHLTTLLIRHEHEQFAHAGSEFTLAEIRHSYWIVKGRSAVRKVIHNCMHCKKERARPAIPIMADLPEFRIAVGEPPFSHVEVDFFGPMQVKRARSTVKRWGCIFTCLVVRAVHLEVVESLETDAFINSLERFMNRRGHPNLIVSDCGSNFRGADRELKVCLKELDQEKIKTFASNRRVKWKFNPPSSPHMGAAWERLVRSAKTALKAILKGRLVDDFSLATIFTEAEGIMNSRPLTATSDDINDLEALTPNHFLLGRASPNLPPGIFYETDISNRKRWRQVHMLTEHLWRRFQREYLPTLTKRPKWRNSEARVQCGDLVLLQDQNAARGDVSENDEIDPALFLALVNESIKLLSEDMCFPAAFRKQFEIFKFSNATDGSTKQKIVDQIWKIWNALKQAGNVEKFYATFYATVVPKASMLFSPLSAHGATLLCTKLADKIAASTRSKEHKTMPNAKSLSDKEKASLQFLGGYVFYNLNRKIFNSKHHKTEIGQQHLSILQAGRADNNEGCPQKLVDSLNRGGLWKINETCQKILTIAELKFLAFTNVGVTKNIDSKKLVSELCVDQDLLALYQTLLSSAALPVDKDVAKDVLERILILFIKVRSFSYAKEIVNKFKINQRKARSKALRKEIQRETEKPCTKE